MVKKIQMRIEPIPQAVLEKEKRLRKELNKWSLVKESICKQKSRIQWLKQGDANTVFFFASMQVRRIQNQINMLIQENGTTVLGNQRQSQRKLYISTRDYQDKTTSICQLQAQKYSKKAQSLTKQQLNLIKPLIAEEVKQALKSTRDSKTLEEDGFNAFFFKQAWPVIGDQVITVVLEFF